MSLSAIVLAAGRGLRFSPAASKPLAKINAKPAIIYCLKTLDNHPAIKDIIVVVNVQNKEAIISAIRKYRIGKVKQVVKGGLRRQDSVRSALAVLPKSADSVLIHDAARPFIEKGSVSCLIKEAKKQGAAILGVPVKATIKMAACPRAQGKTGSIVKKTLNRNNLWEIQTPQLFKKDLILKAYKRFGAQEATDDAMLVEKLGVKVSLVLGSYNNIKITTPEDLVILEAIAKQLRYGI